MGRKEEERRPEGEFGRLGGLFVSCPVLTSLPPSSCSFLPPLSNYKCHLCWCEKYKYAGERITQ
jgi:hypothetical protein